MLKKILERFAKLRNKSPNHGDYIILHKCIEGRNYKKSIVSKAFTRLMSKDQFDKSEKQQLIAYLMTQ